MRSKLRILQANLARAQLATTEAAVFAARNRIDVMILQEPYAVKNTPWKASGSTRIVAANQPEQYPWAIVQVNNPKLRVHNIKQESNEYFAVAQIEAEDWSIYVASVYLRHSQDLGPMLNKMERFIHRTAGKNVIIGGDMNASSTMWGADSTNGRGAELEDFITYHGLTVVNNTTQPPTYSTSLGSSYIDVTLTKGNIMRQIEDWRVWEEETSSDHNLITFSVNPAPARHLTTHPPNPLTTRFCTRALNPTHLNHALQPSMLYFQTLQLDTPAQIEYFSKLLENKIYETCSRTLRRRNQAKLQVKWWTPELTRLKRITYRARRAMQSETDDQNRSRLRKSFLEKRNAYRAKVRKTRKDSWRKFVEEESATDIWGIVYKIMNKRLTPKEAVVAMTVGNTHTDTWEQTAETLLDTFVIKDNPEEDTPDQQATRKNASARMSLAVQTEDATTSEEITDVIKGLKNGKTPGPDLLEVAIIKAAWPSIGEQYTRLYNACLQHGIFPRNWKIGKIHAVLKGRDKDATLASSYRPICLLPIPGKILEKLILRRILDHTDGYFRRQYGFIKGRSTTDAAMKLKKIVHDANTKYVLGIFVDIKGAFDHVWWPDVLRALRETECPAELYNIVHHYLQERTAIIEENGKTISRTQVRGCPQGSVLGPILWNLAFDGLMEYLEDGQAEIIAYADDVAILLTANSRRDLEAAGSRTTKRLEEWCNRHKLDISVDKTVGLLLKGNLDRERMPSIPLLGSRLKYTQEVRYLGIQIGKGLTFTNHVKNIAGKAKQTMNNMAAVARANWGVRNEALIKIYKGTFVPIVTYAAPVWARKLNQKEKGYLWAAQRWALIRCTRAYRTISTSAAPVLAGVQRITDLVELAILRYHHRKGKSCVIDYTRYGPIKGTLKEEAERLQTHQMNRWQESWDNDSKGRTTYEFFPNLRDRMEATWINPDYHTSQLITGHGNFNWKLRKLGLKESSGCRCGRVETSKHVTIHCTLLRELRRELQRAVENEEGTWPPPMRAMVSENCFPTFREYAVRALQHKENLDREER